MDAPLFPDTWHLLFEFDYGFSNWIVYKNFNFITDFTIHDILLFDLLLLSFWLFFFPDGGWEEDFNGKFFGEKNEMWQDASSYVELSNLIF